MNAESKPAVRVCFEFHNDAGLRERRFAYPKSVDFRPLEQFGFPGRILPEEPPEISGQTTYAFFRAWKQNI